ncbi:NAD-dependent epimerase/dehydratase family protein [Piscinibacter aquaticus]|uniref:NAD-dependent epimerase/dehydratase family protein n=1 Tax=Piscinibacter aquaticus TaxID=392597 RepID=A0A5C6U067_9BURK|nr:NAD-dependent epimerase/dehydratase family protein [Piscinibacter aquaticus]
MTTTLVIGASGTVGSELARLLAAQGQTVRRATSRAPASADQVQIDLARGTGIAAALQGVDRAFLLAPPGHTHQHELLGPVIDAARERGLRRVVLMSAMGANADDSAAAPRRAAARALGPAWNVIRPNWFMQNFNTFWLHGIQTQGRILLPVGRAKGSFIDARDIAAVAASLLTRDDLANRDFDLTGAEALDHDEVAAILSRETGRDIRYQEITPEAMLEGLLQAGLPNDYAEFLVLILGFFKAGYAERTTDAVQAITGRAPRRFADYARDHRSALAELSQRRRRRGG